MSFKDYRTSIVVIADSHNPTILHPSFLISNNIVNSEDEILDGFICTPPFSHLKLKNEITFVIELSKFQIIDDNIGDCFSHSQIPRMAKKYLDTLKHVNYTAIGINYYSIFLTKNTDDLMINKFIKKSNWNSDSLHPNLAMIKLAYPSIHATTLNLKLESGNIKKRSEKFDGIIIEGNFHKDLSSDNPVDQLIDMIDNYSDYSEEFHNKCNTIFGED